MTWEHLNWPYRGLWLFPPAQKWNVRIFSQFVWLLAALKVVRLWRYATISVKKEFMNDSSQPASHYRLSPLPTVWSELGLAHSIVSWSQSPPLPLPSNKSQLHSTVCPADTVIVRNDRWPLNKPEWREAQPYSTHRYKLPTKLYRQPAVIRLQFPLTIYWNTCLDWTEVVELKEIILMSGAALPENWAIASCYCFVRLLTIFKTADVLIPHRQTWMRRQHKNSRLFGWHETWRSELLIRLKNVGYITQVRVYRHQKNTLTQGTETKETLAWQTDRHRGRDACQPLTSRHQWTRQTLSQQWADWQHTEWQRKLLNAWDPFQLVTALLKSQPSWIVP